MQNSPGARRWAWTLDINVRVGTEHWSLDVAIGWNARHDPECITITPLEDNCAFQLSAALKGGGDVTEEEVRTCALRLHQVWGSPTEVTHGPFRGFAVRYLEEAVLWRRLWLATGRVLLFVTVNGPPDVCDARESEIIYMLNTLEAKGVDV